MNYNPIARTPVPTILCTVAVVCCLLAGCANQSIGSSGREYTDVVRMSIFVNTVLKKVDNDPYYDGVSIQVLLYRRDEQKGKLQAVAGKGSMNFKLLRRVAGPDGQPLDEELYSWQIPAQDAARSVRRDRFGMIGHFMTLYWGNLKPTGRQISLVGQFASHDGHQVSSLPVDLPLPADQ